MKASERRNEKGEKEHRNREKLINREDEQEEIGKDKCE